MPPIRRTWKKGRLGKRKYLVIPGDWEASLPELADLGFTKDGAFYRRVVQHLLQEGYKYEQAFEKAEQILNACFQRGWLTGLKHSVFGWAVRYASQFPHLVDKLPNGDFTPRGFSPEVMAGYYVPEMPSPGRSGNVEAHQVLTKMGQNAKR